MIVISLGLSAKQPSGVKRHRFSYAKAGNRRLCHCQISCRGWIDGCVYVEYAVTDVGIATLIQ